jgi:hypothetical protein
MWRYQQSSKWREMRRRYERERRLDRALDINAGDYDPVRRDLLLAKWIARE